MTHNQAYCRVKVLAEELAKVEEGAQMAEDSWGMPIKKHRRVVGGIYGAKQLLVDAILNLENPD